jgi:hypothetical protein
MRGAPFPGRAAALLTSARDPKPSELEVFESLGSVNIISHGTALKNACHRTFRPVAVTLRLSLSSSISTRRAASDIK